MKSKTVIIGILSKTHGNNGCIVLRLKDIKSEQLKKMESLFVIHDGLPVPFFIEDIIVRDDYTVILKFDDIDTETDARKVTGMEVALPLSLIKSINSVKGNDNEIIGYSVIDHNKGLIGKVSGIIENTKNPLLTVISADKEILIPFHQDIIIKLNNRRKELFVHAPEGLFDI